MSRKQDKKTDSKKVKNQKAKQPPKPKKERVAKPVRHHGEAGVPDYVPKDERETKNVTAVFVEDIGQLLNGLPDREKYLIEDAVFEKTTAPYYKGGPEVQAIMFYGAITGHKLNLSGVEPGTTIFHKDLVNPVFVPKGKSEALNNARAAIHKYLREALAEQYPETGRLVVVPRPVVVSGPDLTDPRLAWEGKVGIVAFAGMRFRVTEESKGSFRFPVVYVLDAPYETELFGLGGSKTYTTVSQLRGDVFRSKLPEGSDWRKQQERVWTFFRKVFAEEGIGTRAEKKASEKPAVSKPAVLATAGEKKDQHATPVSYQVGTFSSGFPGKYCLDKKGKPKAFFVVESVDQKGRPRPVTVVVLTEVQDGHPLSGVCKPGAQLFHLALSREIPPDMKGDRAPAVIAMWEFLHRTIAEHRREVMEKEFLGYQLGGNGSGKEETPPVTVSYTGNA